MQGKNPVLKTQRRNNNTITASSANPKPLNPKRSSETAITKIEAESNQPFARSPYPNKSLVFFSRFRVHSSLPWPSPPIFLACFFPPSFHDFPASRHRMQIELRDFSIIRPSRRAIRADSPVSASTRKLVASFTMPPPC